MAYIIAGYQGIGKSSWAAIDVNYIDFESSCFFVNGKRSEDWHIAYCECAINLAQQGYNVFISSHQAVRDYLSSFPMPEDIKLVTISPAVELKDDWLIRLRTRHDKTKLVKDMKALANAEDCYDDNVRSIQSASGFNHIVITDIEYDLEKLIDILESHMNIPGIERFYGVHTTCTVYSDGYQEGSIMMNNCKERRHHYEELLQ